VAEARPVRAVVHFLADILKVRGRRVESDAFILCGKDQRVIIDYADDQDWSSETKVRTLFKIDTKNEDKSDTDKSWKVLKKLFEQHHISKLDFFFNFVLLFGGANPGFDLMLVEKTDEGPLFVLIEAKSSISRSTFSVHDLVDKIKICCETFVNKTIGSSFSFLSSFVFCLLSFVFCLLSFVFDRNRLTFPPLQRENSLAEKERTKTRMLISLVSSSSLRSPRGSKIKI